MYMYIHRGPKNATLLFLEKLSQNETNFNTFWCMESRENSTPEAYKFIHLTHKRSHYTLKIAKVIFFQQ